MNPVDFSCTGGNQCTAAEPTSKKLDNLEQTRDKYMARTANLAFNEDEEQPCLFDEALSSCTDERDNTTAGRLMDQGQTLTTPDEPEMAVIPSPYNAPVPIHIQHCGDCVGLQRPATQFDPAEGSQTSTELANAQDDNARPRSLNELIKAIRNRKNTKIDASLQRRLHDFERARHLRRDRFVSSPPWGILGLFAHLSGIRVDLQWAEQCALRRANGQNYVSWPDFVKENDSTYYRNYPIFIIALSLVSSIMMIYTMYLGNWEFAPLNVNPMVGPSPQALLNAGALNTYLLVVENQWWRLFAPLVLHAGIIHFAFNMFAIWFIGGPLEKIHGFYNISCLFIISAVGGNILSALFQPNVISVGASGGIFGLVGVCLADVFVNWDLVFLKLEEKEDEKTTCNHVQVLFWLLFDVFINIIIGLTPFVDNYAHLGGLLYGIFYALPLVDRLGIHFFGKLGFCFKFRNCSLRLFGFVAGCFLLLASSLLLLKSDGNSSPCDSCRFISCAPFPFWTEDKWWDCSYY